LPRRLNLPVGAGQGFEILNPDDRSRDQTGQRGKNVTRQRQTLRPGHRRRSVCRYADYDSWRRQQRR